MGALVILFYFCAVSKKGKILVAMSGGIDSTVAALRLHDEGYEVIGITMKTWDYATTHSNGKKETGCCNVDSFNDARQAAVEHGFPHYILDIRSEFGDAVIENFVEEYLAGRTPNPCVLCNTHIKWNALLKKADALDCEFIATGHYVKVRPEAGRFVISKGKDATKDQSYVLWGLSQDALRRSIFPLGDFHKTEIRQMALDYGYPELAKKSESYEICFVPDNDYRNFLKQSVPGLEHQVMGGNYISSDGRVLGKHKGYPFYTIGQRKGLDMAFGKPMFVTAIDAETNTVTLGEESELDRIQMFVSKLNFVKYDHLPEGLQAEVKIRYKSEPVPAQLHFEHQAIQVDFDHAVKGIAPGQSAVFYEGDDVIAGGIILR
jgi:tRNA-specific 2-thiouridylase